MILRNMRKVLSLVLLAAAALAQAPAHVLRGGLGNGLQREAEEFGAARELRWMNDVSAATGCRITFLCLQYNTAPTWWRRKAPPPPPT